MALMNYCGAPSVCPKEYNILLLGETGVGKSTFINAIANYLKYDTLEEAIAAEDVMSLIPTKFTVTDDNFSMREIISGADENESFNDGASATQGAKIYKFPMDEVNVRIIDTPGMGDTRGIQKDEQNFDNLLNIIGQTKHLHAICILLKPNNSRLTVLFEYCIKQLLTRLERSAADNIVFVFTNSRNTFYRPGDTVLPLTKVLKDIESKPPNVKIAFGKENVFCMDNEAFRFLLAKKQGVQFSEQETKDFDTSWKKSAQACMSFLTYITDIKPHRTQDTISVNEARRLILTLSEPLAIVAKNIDDNVQSVDRREAELRDETKSLDELRNKLYVPVIKIKSSPLNYPRTVCAGFHCTETTVVENVKQHHYKEACHDPCRLKGVVQDVVGTPDIRQCEVFKGGNLCNKCGHVYSLHLHIYYITEPYSDHVTDASIEEKIRTEEELVTEIERKIEELKNRRENLVCEKDHIQSAMAKFAHFLKNSAIFYYNDKYKEYIQMLINNEKSKAQDVDWKLIKSYQLLIRTYEEKIKILDTSLIQAQHSDISLISAVTAEQVIQVVEELYKLSICGPEIEGLYQTVHKVYSNQILRKAENTYTHKALQKYTTKVGKRIKNTTGALVTYFKNTL